MLITDKMRPWAAQVPDFARAHLVDRTDVRLLDQRDHVWARPEDSETPAASRRRARPAWRLLQQPGAPDELPDGRQPDRFVAVTG